MNPLADPTDEVAAANFFTALRPSRSERQADGRRVRDELPLSEHAEVPAADERRDPVALLAEQDTNREQALVPLRYERMTASAFTFLRGAAAVMASDLSLLPNSGINTQLCGDAHLSNFGMFAAPDRSLMFDLNDFDETLRGPFEWDVKRLAASLTVAAAALEFPDKTARKAAEGAAAAYRETMRRLAELPTLDVWYARLDVDSLVDAAGKSSLAKATKKAQKKALGRTASTATMKLTEMTPHGLRFRNEPPVLTRVPKDERDEVVARVTAMYTQYIHTLPTDRLALLARYSFIDVAHKVVGVGSVGTRALVVLMQSGDSEPLLLQIKQAGESVLERYLGPSHFTHHGQRVVAGTQAMQATGDPFLGWTAGKEHDYFVRQLKDFKGAIEPDMLDASALRGYGRLCGAVLARAHARTGDANRIAGYLGDDDIFDLAIADFAMAYRAYNDEDYAAVAAAHRR
jgi:uncharacterized protein (DUF2252 family)